MRNLTTYTFENFSEQRGLPKGSVDKILQDQEGFMWFAIDGGGLYRFDGHTAIVFQHDPNDPVHSLPTNLIKTIHEDRKGRLWVASALGLLQVDKRTGKATMHRPDSALSIATIFEDQQGILWLGTASGIARFDPATQQFGLYPSPNDKYIGIGNFQQDDSGCLWAVNYEGLCRFHPPTGKFAFFPIVTPEGVPIQPFRCRFTSIRQDSCGWVPGGMACSGWIPGRQVDLWLTILVGLSMRLSLKFASLPITCG